MSMQQIHTCNICTYAHMQMHICTYADAHMFGSKLLAVIDAHAATHSEHMHMDMHMHMATYVHAHAPTHSEHKHMHRDMNMHIAIIMCRCVSSFNGLILQLSSSSLVPPFSPLFTHHHHPSVIRPSPWRTLLVVCVVWLAGCVCV